MAANSKIEWTNCTWNPLVGCSVCAAGCRFCYAMRMAHRLEAMSVPHYAGTTKKVNGKAVWTGQVNVAPEHVLMQPLRWKKPRRIFVNSMSDLFHEAVPDEAIDRIFAVMALCPQHTFQVLTKRPARMREYLNRIGADDPACDGLGILHAEAAPLLGDAVSDKAWEAMLCSDWPLPNVWLGTSISDQPDAEKFIPDLLATPAAVHFLSCEPLLGQIDLNPWLGKSGIGPGGRRFWNVAGLGWVICGGESGPKRRPMDLAWARDVRDQCRAAGAPFFFKQVDKVQPIPPDLMVREWPGSSPMRTSGQGEE